MAFIQSPSLSNNPKILNNYLIFTVQGTTLHIQDEVTNSLGKFCIIVLYQSYSEKLSGDVNQGFSVYPHIRQKLSSWLCSFSFYEHAGQRSPVGLWMSLINIQIMSSIYVYHRVSQKYCAELFPATLHCIHTQMHTMHCIAFFYNLYICKLFFLSHFSCNLHINFNIFSFS